MQDIFQDLSIFVELALHNIFVIFFIPIGILIFINDWLLGSLLFPMINVMIEFTNSTNELFGVEASYELVVYNSFFETIINIVNNFSPLENFIGILILIVIWRMILEYKFSSIFDSKLKPISKKVCSNCNTKYLKIDKFCAVCGFAIKENIQNNIQEQDISEIMENDCPFCEFDPDMFKHEHGSEING